MSRIFLRPGAVLLCLGALILTPACTPAADDQPGTAADKDLLAKVSRRLLDACEPVPGWAWPPDIQLEDTKEINAGAYLNPDEKPPQPCVRIDVLLMKKVIQGDPDRLALILGHELSHILLHHVGKQVGNTRFTHNVYTRDQETAADRSGMELMLKAGFSFRKGSKAFQRMKDPELKIDYSSFEGLGSDHPSWDARLALIDEPNTTAWKAMSAFDDGVFFLTMEQYPLAEQCFDRVTKEFPGCYEAWVNLGFACLMEYCDKLDAADLRDYGVGQLLIGGFYRRAESIPLRGRDPKLWGKAVNALHEALHIKNDLTLAKADLGLAYLVHPEGKDVKEAARWLQEAVDAAAKDKTIDATAQAAMLVNLGVADLAGGNSDKGLASLEQGEKVGRTVAEDQPARGESGALRAALLYNRAVQLAAGKDKASKEKALQLFDHYLTSASPQSLWWPLAYEQYAALSKELDQPAKDEAVFKRGRVVPFRLLASVKLKSGEEVTLGQDVKDVVKKLGAGREIAAGGSNLKSVIYDKEAVKLLATDKVLAICLIGADAPALPLRPRGTGAEKTADLRVGMTRAELEAVLPEAPETVRVMDSAVDYRYYRDLGLAVLVREGHVVTLVVAQIPRERQE